MSWTDKKIVYHYKLFMHDMNGNNLGEMTGLLKGGSVNFGRNTDLRKIAKIATKNDNYKKFSMIEIVVETDNDDRESLGWYCIDGAPSEKEKNGDIYREYSLASMVAKCKTHKSGKTHKYQGRQNLWFMLADTKCDDGIVHFGALDGTEHKEHDYGEDGFSLSASDSSLDVLKKLCDDYDVYYYPAEKHIVISKYINPDLKPAEFEFSFDNGTISGDVVINSDEFTTINEYICEYDKDNVHLIGVARADSSTGISPNQREQVISETLKIESMNPVNQQEIDRQAIRHLKLSLNTNKSYEFNGIYCGLQESDIVNLKLNDGVHKCVIDEIEIELNACMNCKYKLKELSI